MKIEIRLYQMLSRLSLKSLAVFLSYYGENGAESKYLFYLSSHSANIELVSGFHEPRLQILLLWLANFHILLSECVYGRKEKNELLCRRECEFISDPFDDPSLNHGFSVPKDILISI